MRVLKSFYVLFCENEINLVNKSIIQLIKSNKFGQNGKFGGTHQLDLFSSTSVLRPFVNFEFLIGRELQVEVQF